jgi:glucosamine--fructose-6-phosphate aminotransferase (isomerizing)
MTADSGATLGVLMGREIAEQPAVFERILREGRTAIAGVARAIEAARPRFVLFAARGTSDHAALYGKYLVEILLQLPAGLASPSSMTSYGARPDLRDVLFVAVSQSGGSPDLVESISTARACGALTLAITNAPQSGLATVAELAIDVGAGPELAVAATKSYTAELLSLYLLIDAIRGGDGSDAGGLHEAASLLVADTDPVQRIAARFAGVERLVVTGRGYSYPTALEAALKLMETSYVSAQAFSGADLMHGPMAMLQENSSVIAIVPDGVGGRAMRPVLDRLAALETNLVVVGGADAAAAAGAGGLLLPAGIDEAVSPLLEIIPLQLVARQLAISKGYDPDQPRGLLKVTQTW